MYKITLRKREPLFVDDTDGLLIKNKWTDKNTERDFKFTVKDVTFTKGHIDYIELIKERREANTPQKDVSSSDFDMYREWRSKSAEERAERLSGFTQCFKLVHGYEPKEELKSMLKSELVKYFSANPKRTYADYAIYRKFLLKNKQPVTVAAAKMIAYFMLAITNDIKNSKFAK